VQVADRFHLLDDLGDAIERLLDRHRSALLDLTLPSTLVTVGVLATKGLIPSVDLVRV
jgi:hypothetical protein